MINLIETFKSETRFTKKSLGQHFLTNPHILGELVSSAEAAPAKNIVEIGPGCGVLTQLLAETKANVIAVELDDDLADFLQRYLFFYTNLKIINANALEIDFREIFKGEKVSFIGNLPYNVSVKIFERVAMCADIAECAVFMFQKEVADRIASKPNSKTYSSLSVFTSYIFDIKKVRDIGGGNFMPNANVMSTVLKFTPKKERLLNIDDEPKFFALLRLAFVQKRKTLKNNLKSIENIDEILKQANLTEKSRAEELSLEQFVALFKVIYAK